MDSAALPSSEMVGWSAIDCRNLSSLLLKISTLSELKFHGSDGSKLNILAPLTDKLPSLARLTLDGAFLTTSAT